MHHGMMLEGEQPSAFANIPAWVHILTFLGAVGNQLSTLCVARRRCCGVACHNVDAALLCAGAACNFPVTSCRHNFAHVLPDGAHVGQAPAERVKRDNCPYFLVCIFFSGAREVSACAPAVGHAHLLHGLIMKAWSPTRANRSLARVVLSRAA